MQRYQLTIQLLEDLHTGSGTGAGEYDALLARDNQNRPVIPASHWLGVWRDNLKRSGLSTTKQLNALFGAANGQRGELIATGLYWHTEHKPAEDSLAWTSSSRETDSRASAENTLRTQEFIPAGTTFSADLWLNDDNLSGALTAACRLTDCLGASRQRGHGRIQATLVENNDNSHKPLLQLDLNNLELRLLLQAKDPLCLPMTGTPDNIIRSECYVRGQVLHGAIVNWLLQRHPAIAQLVLTSKIQVDNAYPLPKQAIAQWQNWRVLPLPLHFGVPKATDSAVNGLPWWTSASPAPVAKDQFNHDNKEEKLKRPSEQAFIFSNGQSENWQSFNAKLAQRMRNTRGVETRLIASPQQTRDDKSKLFTQEEIPEHTHFLAVIRFADIESAKTVCKVLAPLLTQQDCLSVGRGGSPVIISAWTDKPVLPLKSTPRANELTITLTSDLIARADNLGFYDRLTPAVLCKLLNVDELELSNRYYGDYVELHGFNPCTGLPRLPVYAIRRGSTLRLTGDNLEPLREALSKKNALGERTAVGFGRFVVDFMPTFADANERTSTPLANNEERIYALAQRAFAELPSEAEFPALSQWQALRAITLEQIKNHQQRLIAKADTNNKPVWLKNCHGKQTWIEWLIAQLEHFNEPEDQQLFYRALLSQVRLKLRDTEQE
jgi:hypothetical protein